MTAEIPIHLHHEILSRISAFDQLPDAALLSVDEVAALVGRSNASIWRDARRGSLAKPIKFGSRTARWKVGDVRA